MAKYITYDELMKLAMRHYNEGGDAQELLDIYNDDTIMEEEEA